MSARELVEILIEKKLNIAIAESLTAGLITSKLAEIAGVSQVLRGGVFAYQNDIKAELLGVREKTLAEFGAVSEETAIEMAAGVAQKLDAQVAISTTGIAGPTSVDGKPVGLVFIGLWVQGETWSKNFHFSGTREQIRQASCGIALEFAREKLLEM